MGHVVLCFTEELSAIFNLRLEKRSWLVCSTAGGRAKRRITSLKFRNFVARRARPRQAGSSQGAALSIIFEKRSLIARSAVKPSSTPSHLLQASTLGQLDPFRTRSTP